jgi:hypothetical protein
MRQKLFTTIDGKLVEVTPETADALLERRHTGRRIFFWISFAMFLWGWGVIFFLLMAAVLFGKDLLPRPCVDDACAVINTQGALLWWSMIICAPAMFYILFLPKSWRK